MYRLDRGETKKYHFEIWLRGYYQEYTKTLGIRDKNYHPHIRFSRDFNPRYSEQEVKDRVFDLCSKVAPIRFLLERKDALNGEMTFAEVKEGETLEQFQKTLEESLSEAVIFGDAQDEETNLYAQLRRELPEGMLLPFESEQYLLRLTGIKRDKVWFSYDFVTKDILSRTRSKDSNRWYRTVHQFTRKTGVLPTHKGCLRLDG